MFICWKNWLFFRYVFFLNCSIVSWIPPGGWRGSLCVCQRSWFCRNHVLMSYMENGVSMLVCVQRNPYHPLGILLKIPVGNFKTASMWLKKKKTINNKAFPKPEGQTDFVQIRGVWSDNVWRHLVTLLCNCCWETLKDLRGEENSNVFFLRPSSASFASSWNFTRV